MNVFYSEEQLNSRIILGSPFSNTPIVASLDTTPSAHSLRVAPSYDYGSSFFRGGQLGLGFQEEVDGVDTKVEIVEEEENVANDGMDVDVKDVCIDNAEALSSSWSQRKRVNKMNDGFLSIGGLELHTVDLSSAEEDSDGFMNEHDVGADDGLSESTDTHCSFGEDDDDYTDTSDMDEEVMEDYLKGIGGASELFKGTYLEKDHSHLSQGHSHLSQSCRSDAQRSKTHKENQGSGVFKFSLNFIYLS